MVNKESRTDAAIKNVFVTTISQILYYILNFVGRTVFTKTLGLEYLGLGGLFSNILTMLSFAELGIGSVMTYKMYKPLKDQDKEQLILYINFCRKAYHVIALIVALLGLSVLPFLEYVVDVPDININIRFLYILYLIDTIVSYLYVYKKLILTADQKNYIVAMYTELINIGRCVLQIVILVLKHDYIIYLLVRIGCDLLGNVVCSIRAEKIYPFISERTKGSISLKDKSELKENVKGLLFVKAASIIFDGTDNIFISKFAGIVSVGIISNYTLITVTLNTFLNSIFYSITATMGNFGIDSSTGQMKKVFEKLYFLNAVLYGYIGVGMALMLRTFVVDLWIGEECNLPSLTVFLIITEQVLRGMHYPVNMLRSAFGMFTQLKTASPLCALLNITLDFVLGIKYGISGIVTATIITRAIQRSVDIYVIYRGKLGMKVSAYYGMHVKFLLTAASCMAVSYFICGLFEIKTVLLRFIVDIVIITIIYIAAICVIYGKSDAFIYYRGLIKEKIFRRG